MVWTTKMVKVFSLLLILGLALSPPARAEDKEEEAEAGGDEKEAEEEISIEKSEPEAEKLEDMDAVIKKGQEEAKKGGEKMRGSFITRKVISRRITYGTKIIRKSCGCTPTHRVDWEKIWKDLIGKNLKKDDEMVMIIRTTDHLRYEFKCKSDKDTIYWAQKRHGRWPEWKKVDLEEFDYFITGNSIIQFDLNNGVPGYGIVEKKTVIGYGGVEQMPFVINRMWLNYLASKVQEQHPIRTIKVTWKGKEYTNWPKHHPEFLLKPYFLPERNRRVYWVVVNSNKGVQVIPRQPQSTIKYIKWPSFSFPSMEWHFPSLPDSVFDNMCLLDEIGEDCVDSGEVGPGGDSSGGDSSGGDSSFEISSPEDSDILISKLSGEHSFQGQQGCSCQKWCKCTSGGPYKKRQKRSTVDSYKQFLELTKDCVSERRCRKAYSKFMKHGLIKVKSD